MHQDEGCREEIHSEQESRRYRLPLLVKRNDEKGDLSSVFYHLLFCTVCSIINVTKGGLQVILYKVSNPENGV